MVFYILAGILFPYYYSGRKMKYNILIYIISFAVIFLGVRMIIKKPSVAHARQETVGPVLAAVHDSIHFSPPALVATGTIETGNTDPDELLRFAKTLMGIPYLYASTDPAKGFDCSGFVTYVFNHFSIAVPRSSVDFTHVGKEIDQRIAGPGDLILFTGTDSTIRVVGHMGIVLSNENDSLQFIHSTSGKLKGVVITPFERYYKTRFVKVIRIFPDKYFE